MKSNYIRAFSVAVITVFILLLVPLGLVQGETEDYSASFLLLNRPDGNLTYELNVTIPQSLYQYYFMQNHALYSDSDFAKFVTPYALKPIADRLWQIYNNTEDFTNGVLMLVHQITYQEVIPGKYPIETLVNGYGDCDLLADIAASILEAGGIPTVLLFYKAQEHMEIGVDLGSAPKDARVDVYSVSVRNVSYYIAECTGNTNQWRDSWRVGETPMEYQNVSSQVVTLENAEQSYIGQVSANLRELDPSNLNIQVSSFLMLENSMIKINGQILPEVSNENVTLNVQINGGGWTTIGTILTGSNGRFTYNWTPPVSGSITLQSGWVGNRQYNGASSVKQNVFVMPILLLTVIVGSASVVVIAMSVFLVTRRRKPKSLSAIPSPTQNPIDPS